MPTNGGADTRTALPRTSRDPRTLCLSSRRVAVSFFSILLAKEPRQPRNSARKRSCWKSWRVGGCDTYNVSSPRQMKRISYPLSRTSRRFWDR